ncbi:MAG: hemolysin family protein [Clostridia bacterium]
MIVQILIILIIVAIKGIFSAADTAFTYMNKAEIAQLSKKDKKARKIKILMDDTNKFFGIIEVGINMSELISSAVASMTVVNSLAYIFEKLPISKNMAMFLAALIITFILSYVLLVFGGVLPKKIARNNPKKVAYKLVNILWVVATINRPFESLIDVSNRFFTKIFHIKENKEEKLTEKQLKMIIKEARDEGVVANIERKIILNAMKVNDITVKQLMVPKEKVDFIDIRSDFEEVLKNIGANRYTRMPIYDNSPENVVGVFNVKDIAIQYANNKKVETDLTKYIRKVKLIHEDEKIFSAFKKLQKDNQVMAVVVDSQKRALGIVTIEDIVEKLVGKIFDEYDVKV